jgi:hypothetical protein
LDLLSFERSGNIKAAARSNYDLQRILETDKSVTCIMLESKDIGTCHKAPALGLKQEAPTSFLISKCFSVGAVDNSELIPVNLLVSEHSAIMREYRCRKVVLQHSVSLIDIFVY